MVVYDLNDVYDKIYKVCIPHMNVEIKTKELSIKDVENKISSYAYGMNYLFYKDKDENGEFVDVVFIPESA